MIHRPMTQTELRAYQRALVPPSKPAEPSRLEEILRPLLLGFFVSAPFWVLFFIGLDAVLR